MSIDFHEVLRPKGSDLLENTDTEAVRIRSISKSLWIEVLYHFRAFFKGN